MFSWSEIVRFLSKHSNQIQKVTRPLRDCFGIKYFSYHRIDAKGNYRTLLDRPDWAEHYVDQKFYLLDPYQRHPSLFRSGVHWIPQTPEQLPLVESGMNHFAVDVGVTLIERSGDEVEFFSFSAARATSSLEILGTQNVGLLKQFGDHFKKELRFLLDRMEPGCLPEIKGNTFFEGPLLDPSLPAGSSERFLLQIGQDELVRKARSLSRREKMCLHELLDNRSAKEIALNLDLSFRTVEFYFENLKNKLSFSTRHELFLFAKKLQGLGLLT